MRRRLAIALALGLLAPACAQNGERPWLGPEQPPVAEPLADVEGPRVPYAVEIRGVEDELLELLTAISETVTLTDRPPATVFALRRRAQADVPRLLQALRARGYYDAEVAVEVDPTPEPARVTFRVEPGPVYRLRELVVETIPPDSPFVPPGPEELGLESGEPALSQAILDAEAELLRRAQLEGFALAELGDRTAAIERAVSRMDLTLRIEPGPFVRLGEIDITGLEQVEEGYVRRRLVLERDDRFDPVEIAAARERLVETGLFTSVRVRLAEEPTPEDRLPVTVELTERPHRSIGVGAGFRTDTGIGANVSWEHRNFFRRGERVRVEAEGSGLGSAVSHAFELAGSFRNPDIGVLYQTLIVDASLGQLDTEAFFSRSIGARVALERQLARRLHGTVGVAYRTAQVEGAVEDQETFGLAYLPAELRWDTSDALLDPTEGGRLRVDLAPFFDTFGTAGAFAKGLVSYTRYQQVLAEPRIVLAGRAALGTLFGAERNDVPPDERFYAGGGGSVRGFAFQFASPIEDDSPVGGRSLVEFAGEVRTRITETIGAVAFLDAGTAFESSLPDFDEPLRVGAGLGFRYFTPVGPLRLDVAVPLNRRDIDDRFQLYISFGQAF